MYTTMSVVLQSMMYTWLDNSVQQPKQASFSVILRPERVTGCIISRLNDPEENEACLVPRVEEKLLVHRSSTATTLQRVGERFRTVPSGADRRGLSNSAAGITTALRLQERTHSRNRQQTNRPWHPLLVRLSRRQQSLTRAEG